MPAAPSTRGVANFDRAAHWSPEQALAVFECLQSLRRALWAAYGPKVQQAWREQLMPDTQPPEFDPDEPF